MNKNKKLSIVVFIFSLMVGCCSTTPNPLSNNESHEEFDKYLKLFENDMGSRVTPANMKKTSIRFGSLDGSAVGLCVYIPVWGHSMITVDKSVWENYGEFQKKNLIYHELGHCICGLGHSWEFGGYAEAGSDGVFQSFSRDDGFFEDGCPLSGMFPYVMDEDCAKKHWDDYTKDLYNRCYP